MATHFVAGKITIDVEFDVDVDTDDVDKALERGKIQIKEQLTRYVDGIHTINTDEMIGGEYC